jgi:zinc finger HIT domain-containing protein 1
VERDVWRGDERREARVYAAGIVTFHVPVTCSEKSIAGRTICRNTSSMAEGPLRFRTPHIEEIPTTNSRHQPGFAWVAVKKDATDPSKAALDVAGKKRARTTGLGQSEAQREATSARQQREIERRIRDLNSDNTRDVNIAVPKREHGGGGATKAGKTSNTKKILSSGKEFKHYLDDEEAELARTGKIDGLDRDPDAVVVQPVQRARLLSPEEYSESRAVRAAVLRLPSSRNRRA